MSEINNQVLLKQPLQKKLTEKELIRICVDNPQYLGKALGQD